MEHKSRFKIGFTRHAIRLWQGSEPESQVSDAIKRAGSLIRTGVIYLAYVSRADLLIAPEKLTNEFQFAFARLFSWPLSVGRGVSLSTRMARPLADVVSRRKYHQLQNHLVNITAQRDKAYQDIKKLSGLRTRLPLEGASLVSADVIPVSIDGRNMLIINRGREEGLAEGQFVLGDNGIIGTISEVSSRTAGVRLITDTRSKIKVKAAGTERLLEGIGNNSAKIRQLLHKKHKVEKGDKVLACAKPGFLDTPMVAGKITQCKRDDENPLLWDVTVEPVCNIKGLNNVVVIVMNPVEN